MTSRKKHIIRSQKQKQKRKKLRSKSNRTKGRGIMRINPLISDKVSFNIFLSNSQVKMMTSGANGIIFKLTINNIENSTYVSTNADTYGLKVNTLLLKLIFIKKEKDDDDHVNINMGATKLEINLATTTECYEEINIQKCIYSKTNDYLEPICPAIVFDELLVNEVSKEQFLNNILNYASESDTQDLIVNIRAKISDFNICIFAMEFADGYNILQTNDPYIYKEMSMFLLLELALKTGYLHGDIHRGNIMINKTSESYFKQSSIYPIIGKPLLIDFGYAVKIPQPIKRLIQELCDIEEYTKALNTLCKIPRKDGTLVSKYPAYYGWACGSVLDTDSIEVIENRIQQAVQLKEDQSHKLIELLSYKKNIVEETRKTFHDLLKNGNFKKEIEKQKYEYYQEKKEKKENNKLTDVELEREIIINLYQIHITLEIMKNKNEILEIQEQIKTEVLEEMADIRNLNFPENTNRHIKALFDQRRRAEIELETTFKIRYPDGPELPQPILNCNL
jgi:hypothetical protein